MSPLPPEEYARRLTRARNWHLREAGRQRFIAQEAVATAVAETERHEDEALRLERELRALGVDPRPPVRPGAA